jgi:hypothetical protein
MNRTCAVAALAVAATCTTASADSPRLKGSYAFVGTAACLVSPGGVPGATPLNNPFPGQLLPGAGFKPNFQPNDSGPGLSTNAFTRSFSVEGVRTFDGHGHGTVKGTAVGVVGRPTPGPNGYPHFPPSASSGDFSFQFTYVVNPDRTWTGTMVPASYTENFTTGPRAGQTSTVDAIPPVSGVISEDGKTLIAAHLAPAVETRTFFDPNGNAGDVWPEVCHRERVFIKLQDSDDDHDNDHDHDH